MNETLEAMARAIFKDWFVDFGPTRAKMEGRTPYLSPEIWALFPDPLDDEGKPERWAWGTLADLARTCGSAASPTTLAPDTPYIGLEHMPRRSIALDQWEGAEKVSSGKSSFKSGDVLFGKLRPYFHKVGVAPLNGVCSTDIVVMEGTQFAHAAFVAVCTSSDDFVAYTNLTSDGTKMPRTSWTLMARYPVILAPIAVMERFQGLVGSIIDRIVANTHESRTLATTRDLLLPKLMSGEIRIQDAEREVAAVL